MRYTIGCSIEDKATKDRYEGFVGIDSLGLEYVLTEDVIKRDIESEDNKKELTILVYDNLELAEKAISSHAKSYRRDDVWLSPWKKSKKIRKFYLIKIDSSNFNYEIEENKNFKKKKDYKLCKIVNIKNKEG